MFNPKLVFFNDDTRTKDFYVQPHTHSCYELVYFVSTKSLLTIGDKNTAALTDGSFYLVYPNTSHKEIHYEDGRVLYLGFECNPSLSDVLDETVYHTPYHRNIFNLMSSIIKEATDRQDFYNEIIANMLNHIIYLIQRYSTPNKQQKPNIDFAYNYIAEYYNQHIDFKHIANFTGYSQDHFRHIFTKTYGISPKQFQLTMRLEKSVELLSKSKMSCTKIAQICGFSTSAQFSKLFSEKYGITPKQFSKRFQ